MKTVQPGPHKAASGSGVKGHGGGGRASNITLNRGRGTQQPAPSGAPRGSNSTKAATKGSPTVNLKGGSAQQRDPNVYQTYQRGSNPSSTPARKATVKSGSRKQQRGS